MEGINVILFENLGYENLCKSSKLNFIEFDSEDSDARSQVYSSPMEQLTARRNFSIETFIRDFNVFIS